MDLASVSGREIAEQANTFQFRPAPTEIIVYIQHVFFDFRAAQLVVSLCGEA